MNSESVENGFIYKFDMGKDIACFNRLPDGIRLSAECNVVDVIYESFVVSGDQDYLMARLLAQKGLPRGFYWAAAQAVEKFLKAFLLMNGKGVKRFGGHPIRKLFEAACKIDGSIDMFNIHPHQSLEIEASVSSHVKKFTALEFIDQIEKYGRPDNRYNAFGVKYNTGHLFALDSFLFQLRAKIGVIEIQESFGRLGSDLMEAFEINNPWFCSERRRALIAVPSEKFPIKYSSSIAKLQFLIKNQGNVAYDLALQWLGDKMIISGLNKSSRNGDFD